MDYLVNWACNNINRNLDTNHSHQAWTVELYPLQCILDRDRSHPDRGARLTDKEVGFHMVDDLTFPLRDHMGGRTPLSAFNCMQQRVKINQLMSEGLMKCYAQRVMGYNDLFFLISIFSRYSLCIGIFQQATDPDLK